MDGAGPFQERVAQNMLTGRFVTDFYAMVAAWADWATGMVEQWPEDPGHALPDRQAMRDILRRASWSET